MSNLWTTLIGQTSISGVVVLIILYALVQWIAPNIIKSSIQAWIEDYKTNLNKDLENHKHDLSEILERSKAENARLLHNFSLVNTKRHEIYAELYGLFLETQGHMARKIQSLIQLDSFEGYTAQGIKDYCQNKHFPGGIVDEVYAMWDSDPAGAKEIVYRWNVHYQRGEMQKSAAKFHNERLYRELYLSQQVADKIEEIDIALNQAKLNYEFYDRWNSYKGYGPNPYMEAARGNMGKLEEQVKTLEELRKELKFLMQDEMKQGIES